MSKIFMDIREIVLSRDPILEKQLFRDSVIIAALLHDVCKVDIYKSASMSAGIQSFSALMRWPQLYSKSDAKIESIEAD